MKTGNVAIAIQLLLFVFVFQPLSCVAPITHQKRGDSFYQQAQYQQALVEYTKAAQEMDVNRDILMKLAQTHWQLRQLHDCEATLQKIIKMRPADREALQLLTKIYQTQERFEALENIFLALVRINPRDVDALNNLGCLYQKMRKLERAIEHFKLCLKYKPDFPEPYLNCADVYAQDLLDDDTASYFYQRYLSLDPTSPAATVTRKWLQDYQKVHPVESYRARSLKHYYQGEQYLHDQEYGLALREYQIAFELQSDPEYLFKSGLAHKELRNYDEACELILEAIEADPDNLDYLYALGWVYKRKGDIDNARAQWQLILKHDPNHSQAIKALSILN
ncbi:tetratricopeptide repeat protein [candidate division CSSED10-310 bacterium]|uniref:Tetratricopeptide repeat protein n=1 Tax=candidate division CSSED10-310 bacterium TaxID=2855610 RepID=A0ABV6YU59_UNCC1